MYLQQDMCSFELYGTVNAIVCVCDSINYLSNTDQITTVFSLANNYLEAGGIFICDFKTKHYFRDVVADSVIAEDRDDVSFIWDNYYDEEQNVNELALSLFLKEEDDLYRKTQEFHYQIGLTCEDMIRCVEQAGMELLAMYDAFTHTPATDDSERVYVIAREKTSRRQIIYLISCRSDFSHQFIIKHYFYRYKYYFVINQHFINAGIIFKKTP